MTLLLASFVAPSWSQIESIYEGEAIPTVPDEVHINVAAGEFDLRGYELVRPDFLDPVHTPFMSLCEKSIKFSAECYKRMPGIIRLEMLVHPTLRKIAVRSASPDSRNAIVWGAKSGSRTIPRSVPCAAFYNTLFELFHWNTENRYRIFAAILQNSTETAFLFDANEPSVFFKETALYPDTTQHQMMNRAGKYIGAVPEKLSTGFGREYLFEQSFSSLKSMTEEEWKLRLDAG